jgi:hypothetical protein
MHFVAMNDCINTSIQLSNGRWQCTVCNKPTRPVNSHRPCGVQPEGVEAPTPVDPLTARLTGPGSSLKRLLSRIGIVATGSCGCNSMAAQMDRGGPAWCREHIEEIVDVMQAEAEKRKLPFLRIGAAALVKLAIRAAEKAASKQDAAAADWRAVVRTPSI